MAEKKKHCRHRWDQPVYIEHPELVSYYERKCQKCDLEMERHKIPAKNKGFEGDGDDLYLYFWTRWKKIKTNKRRSKHESSS